MEKQRKSNGTFAKGQSGNPGGRKKGVAALVKSLSNDYEDYIIILDNWARDTSLPIKDRRECIKELLNRSLGMPKQSIDATIETPEPIQFVLPTIK